MKIEDYKRIDGWLNVRVNPIDNESLYDFSEYIDGEYHTLSDAHELYNQYINKSKERDSDYHLIGPVVVKKDIKDVNITVKGPIRFEC